MSLEGRLVHVVWEDAYSVNEQVPIRELPREVPAWDSYGVCVADEADYLILARDRDLKGETVDAILIIPKAVIRSAKVR